MTSVGPAVRRLAERLERDVGLRFDGAGLRRLERAVLETAAARGVAPEVQADLSATDVAARADLVDRVTVQETSWFRDPPFFAALERSLLPAAATRARQAGRPVRVWSAGCAHGQEPWSLAILGAELGVPLEVVATDVTRAALARAEAGVYGERELRGLAPLRRRQWLEPTDDGRWRVKDELRGTVRFVVHDLVADVPTLPSADLVLCRYVLIYLSAAAADRVLASFARLLGEDGRLLVGGAESLWHVTDRYAVEQYAGAFAYRPLAPGEARAQRVPEADDRGARHRGPAEGSGARHRGPRPDAGEGRGARHGGPVKGSSAWHRGPAEGSSAWHRGQGEGRSAWHRVPETEDLLRQGEAAVAAGDLQAAVVAFRGAAYLDPDAAVAHVQLGLALEQLGDPGAQRAFRAAWAAITRTGGAGLEDQLDGWRAEELVKLVGTKLGAIR